MDLLLARLVDASGMAAVFAIHYLQMFKSGDHIVAADALFGSSIVHTERLISKI